MKGSTTSLPLLTSSKIVSIATGNSTHSLGSIRDGWFLVRNRADKDPDSFDLSTAEKRLFGRSPWNSVSPRRLGSSAAKSYLGTLLSSKIRECFPTLRTTIQHNLEERLQEKVMLGEPRTSHAARQQYVVGTVRKYEEKAQIALERPGFLHPSMEICREVSRLNAEFDKFMRTCGGTWHFEDVDVDPVALVEERIALQAQANAEGEALPPYTHSTPKAAVDASLNKAFPGLSEVRDTKDLMKTINKRLSIYQVSQLDGIINPDIYPDMYQEQVKKWTAIAERHLQRVAATVSNCTGSILDAVCPLEGDTGLMSRELRSLLASSFYRSEAQAYDRCRSQCEMETKCTRLQSTGSRFGDEILNWRRFRFFEAFSNSYTGPDSDLSLCFNSIHPSLKKNMVVDVHDVLKVYYKV